MKIAKTRLERLFKKMRAISKKKYGQNPYYGHLYFHDEALYASNTIMIVRFEMPFSQDSEPLTMYACEGTKATDDGVVLELRQNLIAERFSGERIDHLDRLMSSTDGDPDRYGVDPKYLLEAVDCFKALGVPVKVSNSVNKIHLTWSDFGKLGSSPSAYMNLSAVVMKRK